MLKKWQSSYLILGLTLMTILIAIIGESIIDLMVFNAICALTMFLIIYRDYQEGNRSLSKKFFNTLSILIIISFFTNLFYNFSFFPQLNIYFLLISQLIKIGVFGYGWLSTVKILLYKQKVTDQTIVIAINAYLFIGIIWSFIYFTVWQINPQAFHITIPAEYELKPWNLVMYFSLTTLTTLGYGDIIPVDRVLMVAANFEAITGAIYLTVIIARLVSLYSL